MMWIRRAACLVAILAATGGMASAYRPVIDAGHGGEDGGAVAPSGIVESALNLQVAERTKLVFELVGIGPIMLREADISLHDPSAGTLREKKVSDLKNRLAAVEGEPDAFLISIHQNTFSSSKYRGAQVFYAASEGSRELAELIQASIRRAVDPSNTREAKPAPDSVYLMNRVTRPAVLVECGFLSNPDELLLLQWPAHQKKLAVAIVASFLQLEEAGEAPKEMTAMRRAS